MPNVKLGVSDIGVAVLCDANGHKRVITTKTGRWQRLANSLWRVYRWITSL